jgi:hypothetical protein
VERVKPVFQFPVFAPLFEEVVTRQTETHPFGKASALFYGRPLPFSQPVAWLGLRRGSQGSKNKLPARARQFRGDVQMNPAISRNLNSLFDSHNSVY